MSRPARIQARPETGGAFACAACGRPVAGSAPGTGHRNHCPFCLASQHVDLTPGDRRSACRGVMDASAVLVRGDGEWAIVHRCRRCSVLRANRIAGDDDEVRLLDLARRPLENPPFPTAREVVR